MPSRQKSIFGAIHAKKEDLAALLPLAVAACLWILFIGLYRFLNFDAHQAGCQSGTTQTALHTVQASVSPTLWFTGWAVSFFCLLFALAWNLALAAMLILDTWPSVSPASRKIALWVAGIAAALTLGLLWKANFGGAHTTCWLNQIALVNHANVSAWTSVANVLTVLTVCTILISLVGLASCPDPLNATAVAARMQHFMIALYSGAALLVFALLEILVLFSWGAAVSPDLKLERPIVEVMGLGAAAIFSLLLISIYAPVSILQHSWRNHLLRQEAAMHPNLDAAKWLETYGLSSAPWKSATAMIAPLLTGALADIIKRVLVP